MALGPYSRGRAQYLTALIQAKMLVVSYHLVRTWALPREEGSRAILKLDFGLDFPENRKTKTNPTKYY